MKLRTDIKLIGVFSILIGILSIIYAFFNIIHFPEPSKSILTPFHLSPFDYYIPLCIYNAILVIAGLFLLRKKGIAYHLYNLVFIGMLLLHIWYIGNSFIKTIIFILAVLGLIFFNLKAQKRYLGIPNFNIYLVISIYLVFTVVILWCLESIII